jgi:hypothetical protein
MINEARPELTPEKRGASRTLKKGAIRACCFLRRHDPFRFEGSSGRIAPQSQSSAEDTPTGDAEKAASRTSWQEKLLKRIQPPKNTRAAPDEGAARVT